MRILYLNTILLFFFGCTAQNKVVSNDKIEQDPLETALPLLSINDFNMKEHYVNYSFESKFTVIINKDGLYQFKDSTLVNAKTKIWLHSGFEKNSDTDSDFSTYGFLEGTIIEGKKEGKWSKKISVSQKQKYVTVKTFNYQNGVLDGKYQVFDSDGNPLFFTIPHPLYPEEYKAYEIFDKDTGYYYDYYYQTGVLKLRGHYKNNKKDKMWIYYDISGNEVQVEIYSNGVLIN